MTFGVSLLNYRPGHVGGIETYIRKLAEVFSASPGAHTVTFIAGSDVADALPAGARRQAIPVSGRGLIAWRCLEAFTPLRARGIARRIDAAGYDAVLFPQQSIFPIGLHTPAVLTVVDVQHLHRPEHYPLFDTLFRRTIYPLSLRRCRRAIAISQTTKNDLVDLCGIAPGKVDVIPLGFDAAPPPPDTAGRLVAEPYFYYPAATFPHKGHADLLRAFAHFKAARRNDVKLVFSGMRTPLWKRLRKQIAARGLEQEVRHLGFVSCADVVSLYRHAEAILFPTRFEGFGMPILEAVRHGKPVFCSDLPVFDELGVPPENRLDFTDEHALAGIMDRLQPTALLKPPITWAACAEKTLQAMVEAVECGCV
jgi:glycosyltransferase involved in cell wall biosynthesis